MKPSELKLGYVVRYRSGELRMVMDTLYRGRLLVDDKGRNCQLSHYDSGLKNLSGFRNLDIVEVWGHAYDQDDALSVSTENRELLWKREEKPAPKKMTVSEICKELGYDVEIVKDSDNA